MFRRGGGGGGEQEQEKEQGKGREKRERELPTPHTHTHTHTCQHIQIPNQQRRGFFCRCPATAHAGLVCSRSSVGAAQGGLDNGTNTSRSRCLRCIGRSSSGCLYCCGTGRPSAAINGDDDDDQSRPGNASFARAASAPASIQRDPHRAADCGAAANRTSSGTSNRPASFNGGNGAGLGLGGDK